MKKIKLYDYQQEMLGNVTKVLTGPSLGGYFYNERGKRVKCANSVMVKKKSYVKINGVSQESGTPLFFFLHYSGIP